MTATLPNGWTSLTLGEIGKWGSGGTPSRSNSSFYIGSIPWFKTGELGPRVIYKSEESISEEAIKASSAKIFPAGSIALAMYGATIGKTSILGVDAATNQACAVVIEDNRIVNKEYLFNYLKLQKDGFIAAGQGGAQPNISQTVIKAWSIPLAPLNEQRRIAEKLDTTLARVDTLNDRLARITPLLKRFRQSVLAAATSGRLTEDWRSQNDIAAEWLNEPAKELSNIVELDMGFAFKSAEFVDKGGIRLLRGDNIEPGNLRWTDAKKYPEDKFEEKRHVLLSCNDIVLAMDRPIISTGLKIAKVKKQDIPCLLVQRVCRVKCGEYLQNDYAYLFLNSQNFIDHLLSVQNGSSVPHISGKQILSYKVKIPSVKEQTEIVRRVETLLAFADRLEARLQSAQTAAERLTPALLAKAFRGELVPQDPNDEPAAELLRRLRAARAADTASKPKRGRAAKASTVSE